MEPTNGYHEKQMYCADHKLKMLKIIQNTNERTQQNEPTEKQPKRFTRQIYRLKCNAINDYVDLSMFSLCSCLYLPCVVFVHLLVWFVDCGRCLTFEMSISGNYRSGFVSFLILMAICLLFALFAEWVFIWKSGLYWCPSKHNNFQHLILSSKCYQNVTIKSIANAESCNFCVLKIGNNANNSFLLFPLNLERSFIEMSNALFHFIKSMMKKMIDLVMTSLHTCKL